MGGTQLEALDSLKQKEKVCYPLNAPGVVRPHPTCPKYQKERIINDTKKMKTVEKNEEKRKQGFIING